MKFPKPSMRAPMRGSFASYANDLDSWRAQYIIIGIVVFDYIINQLALSLSFYDEGAADPTIFMPVNLTNPKNFAWTVIRKLLFALTVSIRSLFIIETIVRIVHYSFGVFVKDLGNLFDAIVVVLAFFSKLVLFSRESLIVAPVIILFRLWRGFRAVNLILEERELQYKAEASEMQVSWEQKLAKEKDKSKQLRKKLDIAQGKLRLLMGEESLMMGDSIDPDTMDEEFPTMPEPVQTFNPTYGLTQIVHN